jgi:hypothetical protein
MRRSSACAALALLSLPALAFGASTPPPGKAAPAVVPYVCGDGSQASVVYESGGDYLHARALITHDSRTVELRAAPTLYGVRYRTATATEGEPALAWSLRGEEAWLTESPDADGYTREEREIIRCVRLRRIGMADAHAADEGHAEPH